MLGSNQDGVTNEGFTNSELRLVILDLEVGGIARRQLGFTFLVFNGEGIVNNVLGLKNFGTNDHDFANPGLQRGGLETGGIGSTIRDLYSCRFMSRDLGFTILDLG